MSKNKIDWDQIRAMSDEEATANALSDPDCLPPTDDMWATGQWIIPSGRNKQQMSLRLDTEVVDYFRKTGKGYQSRMNAVLRHYVESQNRQQA